MKRIAKISSALVLAFGSSVCAWAQEDLSVVEILGKNYYVYEMKRDDSLFGVARERGWDYEQLQALNPKAISPIQKGLKIYYPVDASKGKSGKESVVPSNYKPEPVKHVVKRGESVYAISQMYEIPVETIYSLNPKSKNGIKIGETLILQKNNDLDANQEYYTIRKGDTLYGVAKEFQTTVASIMKLNPGVTETNFKAGESIRLPKRGEGMKRKFMAVKQDELKSISTYKVEKRDTWETIAQKTGVDKDELKTANPEHGEQPKKKALIAVPKIETTTIHKEVVDQDARELTPEGRAQIYDDVHGITADSIAHQGVCAVLLLDDPSSRKDIEFSRGMLSALDKLNRNRSQIDFHVVDGSKQSTEVLDELGELKPDVVFLTSDKGVQDYLTEYAEVSQTPVVNVFDVKNESYTQNPYMIQLLTPSNYFNDAVAEYLTNNYKGYQLLMVGEADENDQLAASLFEFFGAKNVKNLSVEGLRQMPISDSGKYLVYGYAVKRNDINELLSAVESLEVDHPMANMAVIGRPNWIMYDDTFQEKFSRTGTMIPSRFYYDKDSAEARSFLNHYKSLFGKDPVKSYPMYAAFGYDSANYFIDGLQRSEGDVNKMIASPVHGAQSDFDLMRPSNWTGLMNPMVYLVRFTPYDSIERIALK